MARSVPLAVSRAIKTAITVVSLILIDMGEPSAFRVRTTVGSRKNRLIETVAATVHARTLTRCTKRRFGRYTVAEWPRKAPSAFPCCPLAGNGVKWPSSSV